MQIPLCYDRLDNPLYRGGYADVWKGEYRGSPVVVKALRVSSTSDFDKIMSVRPMVQTKIDLITADCVEVLQRGCHLENPPSSECPALVGCDNWQLSVCDNLRVDGKRKY